MITVAITQGCYKFSSSKRNSRPENLGGRRKEVGIFFPKMILAFPSGFIFSMIRPLHFQELGCLLTGSTFSFIKNVDRMFLIRKIILQFEHFMIHCSVRRLLEATAELRHMEYVVDMRELRWQL